MGAEPERTLKKKTVEDLARLSIDTIQNPPRADAFINSLPCVSNLKLDIDQYLQVKDPMTRSRLFGMFIVGKQIGNREIIEQAFLRETHNVVAAGIAKNFQFLVAYDPLERTNVEAFLEGVINGSAKILGDIEHKKEVAERELTEIREG